MIYLFILDIITFFHVCVYILITVLYINYIYYIIITITIIIIIIIIHLYNIQNIEEFFLLQKECCATKMLSF